MKRAHQRLSRMAGAVLSVSFASMGVSAAAAPAFIKIPDIDGEAAKDGKHRDEIEILSWSWGESQSRITPTDGRTRGKSGGHDGHDNMSWIARALPAPTGALRVMVKQPWADCVEGARLPALEFMDGTRSYQISDAVVTSCGKARSRPKESISLNYEKIK